jgi:hypothetical protein
MNKKPRWLTKKQIARHCFCRFFCHDDCDCDDCPIPKGISAAARRFVKIEIKAKQKRDYRPGDTFEDKGAP